MTDSKKISESKAEAVKLEELCSLVLHRADAEHNKIIDDARDEINLWTKEQQILLDAECDAISTDTGKRADEISIRLVSNAKSESNRERLKLQNECVCEARALLQEKLEALREHADYKEILAGLALEAIKELPEGQDISFRLSAADTGFGKEVAAMINKALRKDTAAPVNVTFDPAPGEFNGGVMISSADGRWGIVSDWRAKADELADTIAERVLAAL